MILMYPCQGFLFEHNKTNISFQMLLSNFYIDMEASINMEISKQQVLNDPEYKNFLLQKPTLSQASKDSYVVALKNFMEFSG